MQREHRGSGEMILGLQWLRAIAALGVVLYHSEMGTHVHLKREAEVNTFSIGGSDVLLFFIMSGYVIAMSTAWEFRGIFVSRMAWLY